MSEEIVKAIVDKYVADETFRAEVRADPEGAIRSAGFDLDDEERALLKSIDFTQTDEQLSERLAASAWNSPIGTPWD
ncbi:MAG: Os1348 family NHLP clan protein [Thalassobaculum sp.]|uniref:Os1348 family NHLP clan protein n=1 Tax=Thalassobaculum sp. TaxID=2022740 RepID=UPI0032ECB5C3